MRKQLYKALVGVILFGVILSMLAACGSGAHAITNKVSVTKLPPLTTYPSTISEPQVLLEKDDNAKDAREEKSQIEDG